MIDVELWRMLAAYGFVVLVLFIFQWRGIARKTQLIVATLRMTIQLMIAGYVLAYIFEHPHPLVVVGVVLGMVAFAIGTIYRRLDGPLSLRLKRVIALSMASGSILALVYFLGVVLHVTPWFEPRYVLPIAGMMIGNAMTGVTLGMQSLMTAMDESRDTIEGSLMLGATPERAVKPYVDRAFDAAVLPTLNSFIGMGIVFLPGLMTGQIIAGANPVTAIQYQIVTMLGVLGGVAMSVILATQLGYRTYFSKDARLLRPDER